MHPRLLLALAPVVIPAVGAPTWRSSPAAVPLDRVALTGVAFDPAQAVDPAGPADDRLAQLGYRYGTFRYATYRSPAPGYRISGVGGLYRYGNYSYAAYRYGGYQYGGYRYAGIRYGSYRYGSYGYGSYRYGGYRYASYGFVGVLLSRADRGPDPVTGGGD